MSGTSGKSDVRITGSNAPLAKDYAALRTWYLARLRKAAVEESMSGSLTPLALIKADREVIERLIAEKSAEQAQIISHADIETVALAGAEDTGTTHGALRRKPRWLDNVSLPKSLGALAVLACALLVTPLLLLAHMVSERLDSPREIAIAQGLLVLDIAFGILLWFIFYLLLDKIIIRRLSRLRDRLLPITSEFRYDEHPIADNQISAVEELVASLAGGLNQSTERERAIADYAAEVLISLDSEGRIVAASPSMAKVWGYKPDQISRRRLSDFVFSEDIEETQRVIKSTRAANAKVEFDNRITCLSGEHKDMHWSLEWSTTHELLFCVAEDITAAKEIERLKHEFFAMVSHDLRTPLAAVLGAVQLLEAFVIAGEETLTDRSKLLLTASCNNAHRLLSLVNEILDAEKLSAGKLVMNFADCDLAEIVKTSIESVDGFAQQQKVKLESKVEKVMLSADSGRLVQAVVNLLSNAIKFSPADSTVLVTIERENKWVILKVKDQGPGIPAKFRDQVFGRFQQGATKGSLPGSGIGLAICKDIVKAHNGEIGFDTEEGNGATFWIKLAAPK